MKIFHYTDDGFYIGSSEAQLDPLESQAKGKEVFAIPRNATTEEPPKVNKNQIARWFGKTWAIEKAPADPTPEVVQSAPVTAPVAPPPEEPVDSDKVTKRNARRKALQDARDRLKAASTDGLTLAKLGPILKDVVALLVDE